MQLCEYGGMKMLILKVTHIFNDIVCNKVGYWRQTGHIINAFNMEPVEATEVSKTCKHQDNADKIRNEVEVA